MKDVDQLCPVYFGLWTMTISCDVYLQIFVMFYITFFGITNVAINKVIN